MRLYHASTLTIEQPRIVNRFATLDLGTGFYTTTNESQAAEFAVKTFFRRKRSGHPTVNVYEIDPVEMRRKAGSYEIEATSR